MAIERIGHDFHAASRSLTYAERVELAKQPEYEGVIRVLSPDSPEYERASLLERKIYYDVLGYVIEPRAKIEKLFEEQRRAGREAFRQRLKRLRDNP
jgi:hypothetical protein